MNAKKLFLFLLTISLFIAACGPSSKASQSNESGFSQELQKEFNLAQNLKKQKKYAQAQKILEQILKDHPKHIDSNLLLGEVYYLQKNYKLSLKFFTNVTALGEKKADVFFQIANNHKNLKEYYSALNNYKRAIKLDPLLTQAYLKIGDIYLEWRDFTTASHWYNRAVKTQKKVAGTLAHIAKLQYQMSQYRKAGKTLENVFKINPMDYEARVLELNILEDRNNRRLLLSKIKKFNKDFPKSSKGFLLSGRLYLSLKDFRGSYNSYKKALQLAPKQATSYNGMGNYFYETGKLGAALKYYQKALQLNPSYVYVPYNIGLVKLKQKKYKSAEQYFLKAYSLNRLFSQTLFFISVCNLETGNSKKAINYLLRFYKADALLYSNFLRSKEHGSFIGRTLQYFWTYYDRSKDFDKGLYVALVDSRRRAIMLLRKNENNTEALFFITRLYSLLGNEEKAKDYFFRYLKQTKIDKEALMQDGSLNFLKAKSWFLKALENK